MKKRVMSFFQYTVLGIFILVMFFQSFSVGSRNKVNIVLDPGHGTNYNYHTFILDDYSFTEYELNWKIANYLYDILDMYSGIEVHLTKEEEEEHPDLNERVKLASRIKKESKLDTYLISLHNNSRSDGISVITDKGQKGCMVLASNMNYKKKVSKKIDKLASLIVDELSELGLYVNFEDKGGIWRRSSKKNKYPNGKPADYYGLIRRGVLNNIPTIIVEHAYMTDTNDVINYLMDDEALHSLAVADAKAIIKFLGLKWQDKYAQYPGPMSVEDTD